MNDGTEKLKIFEHSRKAFLVVLSRRETFPCLRALSRSYSSKFNMKILSIFQHKWNSDTCFKASLMRSNDCNVALSDDNSLTSYKGIMFMQFILEVFFNLKYAQSACLRYLEVTSSVQKSEKNMHKICLLSHLQAVENVLNFR